MGEAFLMNQKGGLKINGATNVYSVGSDTIKKGQFVNFKNYETLFSNPASVALDEVTDLLYPKVVKCYQNGNVTGYAMLAKSNGNVYFHQLKFTAYGQASKVASFLVISEEDQLGESTNTNANCHYGIAFLNYTSSSYHYVVYYGKGISGTANYKLYLRKIVVTTAGVVTMGEEFETEATQTSTNAYGNIIDTSSTRIAFFANQKVYVYDVGTDGTFTLATSTAFNCYLDTQVYGSNINLAVVCRSSQTVYSSMVRVNGTTITTDTKTINTSELSTATAAWIKALDICAYSFANNTYYCIVSIGGSNGTVWLVPVAMSTSNTTVTLLDNKVVYSEGTGSVAYHWADIDIPNKVFYVGYVGNTTASNYRLKKFNFDYNSNLFVFSHGIEISPVPNAYQRSFIKLINTNDVVVVNGYQIKSTGFKINRLSKKQVCAFDKFSKNINTAVATESGALGDIIKAVRPYENIFDDPQIKNKENWINYYPTRGDMTIANNTLTLTVTATSTSTTCWVYYKEPPPMAEGEIFYIRLKAKTNGTISAADMRLGIVNSSLNNLTTEWQTFSWRRYGDLMSQLNPVNRTLGIQIKANATVGETISIKDIEIYNLTDLFGIGNEPTQAWCDENL